MLRVFARKVPTPFGHDKRTRSAQFARITSLVFMIAVFLGAVTSLAPDSTCFAAKPGSVTKAKPAPAKPGAVAKPLPEPTKPAESTVVPDQPKPEAATPADTAPVAPTPPPAPKVTAVGPDGIPLITNVFSETDLRQALSDISAQTGVNILADATVQGVVSADIKDMELERALTMLLMSGGFTFAKMDGFYLVGLPDPANPNFSLLTKTEYFPLKHTAPQVVISLLSQPYGRYLSAVSATPQTMSRRDQQSGTNRNNTSQGSSISGTVPGLPDLYGVVITAPPGLISRIKADITALDYAPTQIMLDAVVVELNEDALKDLGIDWATRWLSQDLAAEAGNLV